MAIETLNIDGEEMQVANLSTEVQRLVAVYEKTHTERTDLENKHIALSAALRQLSVDITTAVRQDAARAAAEEAEQEQPQEQTPAVNDTI